MQTSLLYACSCVQVAQFNNQKGSNAAKTPSHGCNLIKVRSRVIWRANATIHIRRGSARCSINGIPVVLRVHWHIPPSFLPALVLFFFFPRSFQVDLKNHPFLFSRSHSITCCYKLQSPLPPKYENFAQTSNSSTKPWYIYFFDLYRARKPINYTCIES